LAAKTVGLEQLSSLPDGWVDREQLLDTMAQGVLDEVSPQHPGEALETALSTAKESPLGEVDLRQILCPCGRGKATEHNDNIYFIFYNRYF
jgi:hypothetical protein